MADAALDGSWAARARGLDAGPMPGFGMIEADARSMPALNGRCGVPVNPRHGDLSGLRLRAPWQGFGEACWLL